MSATQTLPLPPPLPSRSERVKSLFLRRQKKERNFLRTQVNSSELDKLFAETEVNNLYDAKRAAYIKQQAFSKISSYNGDQEQIKNFIEDLREIFTERKNLRKKYSLHQNKKADIIRAERQPHIVDFNTIQGQEKITPGFYDTINRPRMNVGGVVNASAKGKEFVENPAGVVDYPYPADKISRNIIWDLEEVENDQIRANNGDLVMRLGSKDRLLNEEERQALTTYRPVKGAMSNIFEAFATGASHLVHYLGRGMWSKTDARRTEDFEKLRAEIFERIARQIYNTQLGSENYASILKRVNDAAKTNSNSDLLSYVAQETLAKLINDQIKVEQKANEEKIEAFNKAMTKEFKNFTDDFQKIINEDDAMWKYRLLHVFLLMSPFAAVTGVGFLFDYMGLISDIINPIFGTDGLAKGIGRLASTETLGPLGWISEQMQIPEITEFALNNVPIVSQVVNCFDALVQSEVGQGLFGTLLPVVENSVLTPLLIAGVFSLSRLNNELGLHKKKSTFLEGKNNGMKKAVDDFSTSIESEMKARKDAFSTRITNELFGTETCKMVEMTKFFMHSDDKLMQFIISDASDEVKKSLTDAKQAGKMAGEHDCFDQLKAVDAKELEKIKRKFLTYLTIEHQEVRREDISESEMMPAIFARLEELDKLKATNAIAYNKKLDDSQNLGTKIAENNVLFYEAQRRHVDDPRVNLFIKNEDDRSAAAADFKVKMARSYKELLRVLPQMPNPEIVSSYTKKLMAQHELWREN